MVTEARDSSDDRILSINAKGSTVKIGELTVRQLMLVMFILATGFLLLNYSTALSQYFWDEDDYAYVSVAMEKDLPFYIFNREYYVQEFPRPLVHLYFWLIALFAGTLTWPYYLANLLMYAGGVVLLFRLVHRLSGSVPAGVLAGAFYLMSPCATDSLYWVAAGATGFTSGFFILLTANLYLGAMNTNDFRHWIPVWIAAVIAMGLKESALSLPLLLLLLEFSGGRPGKGWARRVLPFFVLAALMALNVILVQLSFPRGANFAKYGPGWTVLRNLMHFFIYPLVGAMPPSVGEYTLVKLILYPVLWILPVFIGTKRAKRFVFLGLAWIFLSSLPFLQWKMGFKELLPRVCDISSRYFNIPSMGVSLVVAGLCMMIRDRFGSIASRAFAVFLLVAVALTGVRWTHEEVQTMADHGATERHLLDAALSSWNGADTLYIGFFGLREMRILFYNRMYFNDLLVQVSEFPDDVSPGARMLCGPSTYPRLFRFTGREWTEERSLDGWE